MAYIRRENGVKKGPYPNKRGEFCGNHFPNSGPTICADAQAHMHYADWLSKMRFGRPRPCEAGTTEELEQQGMVGLYLKCDAPSYKGEIDVPTPEDLKEPNENQSNT